jgi:hypothetical protein
LQLPFLVASIAFALTRMIVGGMLVSAVLSEMALLAPIVLGSHGLLR